MAINISSKYEETKARLIKKLRQGSIKADEAIAEDYAEDHICYFCVNRINGGMRVLKESRLINGNFAEQKYYLHKSCYEFARSPGILN